MIALLLLLILCVLLFGASTVLAGLGRLAFIAIALCILCLLAATIISLLPKVPRAIFAFVVGYGKVLGAPVLGPIAMWRSINERRASGERLGVTATGLTLVWTFVVGVIVGGVAFGILIGIATSIYQASMR